MRNLVSELLTLSHACWVSDGTTRMTVRVEEVLRAEQDRLDNGAESSKSKEKYRQVVLDVS